MKRLIAVLLVMGVIMTAFAGTATGTQGPISISNAEAKAADTDVVLILNQNAGIVWFSKGDDNQSISTYSLSLPESIGLNQSTSGNNNLVATGTDLKLNWNIVSSVPVSVYLEITAPMVRTDAKSITGDDKIGWKVKSGGETISVIVNDTGTASNGGKVVVHTKDILKYGEADSQIIEVETDNVWGKNNGTYTATLTAYIKTGN